MEIAFSEGVDHNGYPDAGSWKNGQQSLLNPQSHQDQAGTAKLPPGPLKPERTIKIGLLSSDKEKCPGFK